MVRSNFLVHWTGKDIEKDRSAIDNTKRIAYLTRLRGILEEGFWMTVPPERLIGNNGNWIEYNTDMTCFTEIRLSQTETHSRRYGLLGVAVDREFVLDRFGSPVHYVRNSTNEAIIGNTQVVLNALRALTGGNLYNGDDIVNYYAIMAAFLKPMSNPNSDDFEYLEEHEWRIIHTFAQVAAELDPVS